MFTRRPPSSSLLAAFALAVCWVAWATANALGWTLKGQSDSSWIWHYSIVDGGTGLIACASLFFIYSALRTRLGIAGLLAVGPVLWFIFGSAWHVASAMVLWSVGWMDSTYLDARRIVIAGGLMVGVTLGLFSMLFLAVDHWGQLREQREKAREATALAHQAQLQMLRYQLNPHFFFNALNSIRAMIVENPARARQIVTELAEFMRYSLQGRGPESTVRDELKAVENYLAIQRMRFEERLDATIEAEPAAHDVLVPCFLVYPLVENAVKYGMETGPRPLRLRISIHASAGDLHIRVANTGRLVPPSPVQTGDHANGTGTGLDNVRRRLELAYPAHHSFSLAEKDGEVEARITLSHVRRLVPS